jgi:hypothetical protein
MQSPLGVHPVTSHVPLDVRLVDPEPNGLAEMLAGLIRGNLAREPTRSTLLEDRLTASISAPDAGVAATIRIANGRVDIHNGARASVRLRVSAASSDLLELSAAPLRAGIPDPLTPEGRRVAAKVLRRKIRVHGLALHPRLVARLTRVLSAR